MNLLLNMVETMSFITLEKNLILSTKYLFYPLSNLVCPILLNGLSLESSINDVNHLPTEVDEEDGESPVGHNDDNDHSFESNYE